MNWLWLLIGGAAGWFLREIIGIYLSRLAARAGRIGCIPDKCGFYNEVVNKEGKIFVCRFDPDHSFLDTESLSLIITAQVFNDTDTALVLKDFKLYFWGPQGLKIIHNNPVIHSRENRVNTLNINSHDTTQIETTIPIRREDLNRIYAETLPVLNASDINGREYNFRVTKSSFCGKELVVWPSKERRWPRYPARYPIYNKLALNPVYSLREAFLVNLGIRPPKKKNLLNNTSGDQTSAKEDESG